MNIDYNPSRVEVLLKLFGGRWELVYKLFPLCQGMFYETNPIPVKTSLALMGKIREEIRLPLAPLAPANLKRLKKALQDYGVV